jgi:hypothetical protein
MTEKDFELDYKDMEGSYQKIVEHYNKGLKKGDK